MILAVTGTPGTGKTILSKKLARAIGGKVVGASNAAVEGKCVTGESKRTELIVNLPCLRRTLLKILKEIRGGTGASLVLDGHLLCEFNLPVDRIIVLRADPRVIRRRLKKRGYGQKKIDENVLAEILDYCIVRTQANYPEAKIVEIDSSKNITAAKALEAENARRKTRFDWTPLLLTRAFSRIARGG